MMLLGVMGIRFGNAGLREITIESEAVAEGSIEKILEGKTTTVLCDFTKLSMKHKVGCCLINLKPLYQRML